MQDDTFDINKPTFRILGEKEPKRPLVFAVGGDGPIDIEALKLVLGVPELNPNLPDDDDYGMTALHTAAKYGKQSCMVLLLSHPRMNPNLQSHELGAGSLSGATPLFVAVWFGMYQSVKVLLADDRVNPNLCASVGQSVFTPLMAAAGGMTPETTTRFNELRCVELLLANDRVDVNRRTASQYALKLAVFGCKDISDELDVDPTHCVLLMLKSRRILTRYVRECIKWLRSSMMPTKDEVAIAEAGSTPLTSEHKMALRILPVLEAHEKGEFRWCAHCLKLSPDKNLTRCGGCKQVAYCELEGGTSACHKAHWFAGHNKECARFKAEAEVGSACGSGGGGRRGNKKKGKGKKKKGKGK
jgi:hypothetical protein